MLNASRIRHMHSAIQVLLLSLAVATAARRADAQEATNGVVVRIEIRPDTVLARTTEHFIGLGYETSAVARHGYFSPGNKHLVQLLRTLSPHGMIRIGGNVSDYAHYVPDGTPIAAAEPHETVFTRAELADLGAFARETGWDVMWGLNLKTGTARQAAEEAAAVRAALGDRLHSFEAGNEPDLQRRFQNKPDDYLAAYREYKAAVRAAVPDAPFSGPDVAGGVKWVEQFAQSESHDPKLLTHHYYRGGAKAPDSNIQKLLATDTGWEGQLAVLQQISTRAAVPFRFNEINSFFGGGKPGVSDTFASSLWCLDTMLRLASHGCEGVNLETDVNQKGWVSHYSPIFRDETGRLIARPEYYGLLAFSLAGTGDLLKSATAPAAPINLTAYATRNAKGELWVIVINKDLAQPADVELAIPAPYTAAHSLRLAAPSAASTDHVTLAAAEVSPDGTWKPAEIQTLAIKDGVARFPMPAATAVLVRLHVLH